MFSFEPSLPLYALLLSLPAAYIFHRHFYSAPATVQQIKEPSEQKPLKTIMQPARTDLLPPKDDPFTLEQLKQFDGSDPTKPIYVAIKGAYP